MGNLPEKLQDVCIPLPGINEPDLFENWTKCVMGFNIMRKTLRKLIEHGAKENLRDMPRELICHFKQFSECLKENKVKHLKRSEKKRISWPCDHELCRRILDYLIENHAENGKVKKQWDTTGLSKPVSSKVNSNLNGDNKKEDNNPERSSDNNPQEDKEDNPQEDKEDKEDSPQEDNPQEDKEDNPQEDKEDNCQEAISDDSQEEKDDNHQEVEVILDNYFCDIMKLYTYNDTVEGNSEQIDKMELVLLLQILSSCEFPRFRGFKEADENELRAARNAVMHSGDSTLDISHLHTYLDLMIKALENFGEEFLVCKAAIDSLIDLKDRNIFKIAQKRGELTFLIEKALKSRKRAIEFDIETCIDKGVKFKLNNLLESTRNQLGELDAMKTIQERQELEKKIKDLTEQLENANERARKKSLKLQLAEQETRKIKSELEKAGQEITQLRARIEELMGPWQSAGKAVDRWFHWNN